MRSRLARTAVTAGLVAAMTVGQVPAVALGVDVGDAAQETQGAPAVEGAGETTEDATGSGTEDVTAEDTDADVEAAPEDGADNGVEGAESSPESATTSAEQPAADTTADVADATEGTDDAEETGGVVPVAFVNETIEDFCIAGVAPVLDPSAEVTMSDGSTQYLRVTWDEVDPSCYAEDGDTFTVNGHVDGLDTPCTAKVTAYALAEDSREFSVSSATGEEPQFGTMGRSITVYLTSGDYETLYDVDDNKYYGDYHIKWESVNPSAYATAGNDFDVHGTIVGSDVTITVHVHVANVTRLASIPGIKGYYVYDAVTSGDLTYFIDEDAGYDAVAQYFAYENMARAYLDDGTTALVEIDWDIEQGYLTTPGTYAVKGTVGNYEFEGSFAACRILSAEVTEPIVALTGVNPTSGAPIDVEGATLWVYDGTGDPTVGKKLEVDAQVDSGGINDEICAEAGTYKTEVPISGGYGASINGFTTKLARATVEVCDDVASQEEVSLWTVPGAAPKLPDGVDATVVGKDGAERDAYFFVTWDEIDPALYSKDANNTTFTVRGVIEGSNAPVEAKVTVSAVESVVMPTLSTLAGQAPTTNGSVGGVITSDGVYREADSLGFDDARYYADETYAEAGSVIEAEGYLIFDDTYAYNGKMGYLDTTVTVKVLNAARVFDDADVIEDLLSLTTEVGVVPLLPGTVPVELEDGTVVPASVTWDPITERDVSEAGSTVQVKGRVDALSGNAAAQSLMSARAASADGTVTVTISVIGWDEATRPSYAEPFYASVPKGASDPTAAFPFTDTILYWSNGNIGYPYSSSIAWDTSTVDMNAPGTYVMYGTSDVWDGATFTAFVNVIGDGTEEPSEPEEPTTPAEPTEPSEPEKPTDPSEPTDPEKPTDPTTPTEPSEPADPTTPAEPTDPTPTTPTAPTDPNPTDKPSQPSDTNTDTKPSTSDTTKDAGDKKTGGAAKTEIPQTGDPTSAAALVGGSGLLALAGAWIAQRRNRT